VCGQNCNETEDALHAQFLLYLYYLYWFSIIQRRHVIEMTLFLNV